MKYCPLCKADLLNIRLEETERLSCSAVDCDYVYWNNPIPVVAAIVDHDDEIILANNVAWPRHWYSIITGFLEKDETPERCVSREVKEELNLDTIYCEYVGIYSFLRMNQLIIAFYVKAEGEVELNHELHDYKRMSKETLRPWDSETGYAVRDWLISQKLYKKGDGYIDFKREQ